MPASGATNQGKMPIAGIEKSAMPRYPAEINAVVHSHSPTMIPFSVTGEPLKAVSHIASFLAHGCPVFEIRDVGITQGLLVTNNKQGEESLFLPIFVEIREDKDVADDMDAIS